MSDVVRLARGLHRPLADVGNLAGRCAAYLSIAPPGTVVGALTAGRLKGLWLPRPRPDERVELVVTRDGVHPHELAGTRRPEIRLRRRSYRPDEVVMYDGLPMPCEARIWIDAAEYLRVEDLVALGDCVLRGHTTLDDLTRCVTEARHRRGVVRAREALPLLNPRSRSRPESYLRVVLVRGGLPPPEVNVALHDANGAWVAEPDLLLRRARLAIEYNGVDAHNGLDKRQRDMTRELDIEDIGWKVLSFGAAEVFGPNPRALHHVRRELDLRDPGWRRRTS